MFHPKGYEWLIYGLSLLSIMLLGTFSFVNSTGNLSQSKLLVVKKICLGIFIITSMYWIITFPSISSYHSFSDKSDYPDKMKTEEQSDYIAKNHRQIENLERELQETRDQMEAFSGRIDLFFQMIMYGLIYFGASWIFTSNKKDPEDIRKI